jgi:hypothetical protein
MACAAAATGKSDGDDSREAVQREPPGCKHINFRMKFQNAV